MATLPVIDFGPFLLPQSSLEDKAAVAAQIDRACRESGFFYLRGHGVPQELLDGIRNIARTFFQTATAEEKQSIALKRSDEGGDNARGYRKVVAEKGSHEAVDFYRSVVPSTRPYKTGMGPNQWPKSPANFRPVAEAYIDRMQSLGLSVIEALALGLGVESQTLLSRVDEAFWSLSVLGYEGRDPQTPAKSGIGEHTDFGILTFLLTDQTRNALQVLNKDGQWIYADPGCFLCNIGDMLAEWTRGAYKSTLHRVVHSSATPRISVPFFFDPNLDAFIEPLLPASGEDDIEYSGIKYRQKFTESVEKPLWREPLVAVES
ncbi:hypothetical protein LTR85_005501 [Meristemomyces frigidus]|nr:hypothetical protein LTR85_005501 [Meristemomyces frigidus]